MAHMSLTQMSVSGAVLILATVVIRAVALNRLPKKTFLVLWYIAILRLFVPFSVPSAFSVYSLIGQSAAVSNLGQTAAPVIQLYPTELTGEAASVSASHASVWFVVWLAGTVLCAAVFAVCYVRCRFEFSTSLPVENAFVEQWLAEYWLIHGGAVKNTDKLNAIFENNMPQYYVRLIRCPVSINWQPNMSRKQEREEL